MGMGKDSHHAYNKVVEQECNETTSGAADVEVGLVGGSEKGADALSCFNSPGVLFAWHGMDAHVRAKDKDGKEVEKQILHGVSGEAHAGEVLAILGPSGAGKTSLLNLLSARPSLGKHGRSAGTISIDGAEVAKEWQRGLGYVMQRDIFFEELTVQETLMFTAMLRLPFEWELEKKAQTVAELTELFGLEDVVNTKIGTQVERGLSGGEIKRVSIVNELLSDPQLLILDEPMTGLDSTRATLVMRILKTIASKQKTVILTIHQPSSVMFEQFDRIMLLAPGGHMVYQGGAQPGIGYFESLGFKMPPLWVPTDFWLDLISDETTAKQLIEAYNTGNGNGANGGVCHKHGEGAALNWNQPAPLTFQVWVLMLRGFKQLYHKELTKLNFALNAGLALLWGLLWFNVGSDLSDEAQGVVLGKNQTSTDAKEAMERFTDYVGIIFFFVAHWSWYPLFSGLNNFPAIKDMMIKERASQSYSTTAFFIAKVLCEIPVSFIMPAWFYIIAFPLVGFPLETFFSLFLVIMLNVQVSLALSMVISVVVMDQDKSIVYAIVIMAYQMCAGGYFADMLSMPWWINWVRFMSYWYYSLAMFFEIAVMPFGLDEQLDEINTQYSFSQMSIGTNITIMVLFTAVFRLVAYLQLLVTTKLEFK